MWEIIQQSNIRRIWEIKNLFLMKDEDLFYWIRYSNSIIQKSKWLNKTINEDFIKQLEIYVEYIKERKNNEEIFDDLMNEIEFLRNLSIPIFY